MRKLPLLSLGAGICLIGIAAYFALYDRKTASDQKLVASSKPHPSAEESHFGYILPIGVSLDMFRRRHPAARCRKMSEVVLCTIDNPEAAACPAFVPCSSAQYIFRGNEASMVSAYGISKSVWDRIRDDIQKAYGTNPEYEIDSDKPRSETWTWQRPEGTLILTAIHGNEPTFGFAVGGFSSLTKSKPVKGDSTLGLVFAENQDVEQFTEEQPGAICSTEERRQLCKIDKPITPQCPGLRPCSDLVFYFHDRKVKGFLAEYDCVDWERLLEYQTLASGKPTRKTLTTGEVVGYFFKGNGRALFFAQSGIIGRSSLTCRIGYANSTKKGTAGPSERTIPSNESAPATSR